MKEATRIPTAREVLDEQFESLRSNYPLRVARGAEDSLYLREEERENHLHIIGTTGEGKSKFLEWLIRGDIDNGNGLCFLDPSDRGDTMYKILRYCQKIGHRKVLVIDPHHRYLYGKIAPINPFSKYKEASVANVLDLFRILFNVRDAAETARIQRYLTAILSVLWNAKATLHESVYFTDLIYKAQRLQLLSHSDELDRHRLALEEVFTTRAMYLNEIQSTVRRLEPLFHPTLDLMLSCREGIKFTNLIADGWVVLVNLYSGFGVEPIHTRLLGTLIINEIISALDRLRSNNWRGVFYLYVDEAGRYANRNLADLLAYKRKSGLRVGISHQYFKQFEDSYILDAVKQLCKIKVAFFQPDSGERMETVKQMFGGDLKDRDVSYALGNLRKQHCVIKKPKEGAMIVRVPDVPDIDSDLKPYLETIYKNPVYKIPEEILEEQKRRISYDVRPTTSDTRSTSTRKANDRRTTRADSVSTGAESFEDLQVRFGGKAGGSSSVSSGVSTDAPNPSGSGRKQRQGRKKKEAAD